MYEIGTWGSLEALLGIALAFRNSVVGKVGATPPPPDPAAHLGIPFAEFAGQVAALDGEDSGTRFEASGAGQSPSEILVRLVAEVGRDPRCVDGALTVEPKATISIRWAAPVDVPQTGIMCHELAPTPGRTSPLPFDVRCRARTAVGT